MPSHCDVCIAGAGIIGLSLALELSRRGARVTLLDRGAALAEASTAAAGMLAAHDPSNPPPLKPLAELSLELYPAFLDHIANLSDVRVPFQTELTLQHSLSPAQGALSDADLDVLLPSHALSGSHMLLLDEHSLDPRQLASALLAAAANTSIRLQTNTAVLSTEGSGSGVTVSTKEEQIAASSFVDCTGAWTTSLPEAVSPRKGQMLSVALPPSSGLWLVLRSEEVYIVPRTVGPEAGRALIGATVEDAGFDKLVNPTNIDELHRQAARLLPYLADAPVLERWAGLRPATSDELPLIGPHPSAPGQFLATGHFRNGILLAPVTAHIVAQLVLGKAPAIDLAPFTPMRFSPQPVG